METAAYTNWLEQREVHRQDFYGEQLPPDDDFRSLAELACNTNFWGAVKQHHNVLSEIHQGVYNILDSHNIAAGVGGASIYAFTSSKSVEYVADIVTHVIFAWERSCTRHAVRSPFEDMPIEDIRDTDFTSPSVQKVVEIGATVLELLQGSPGLCRQAKASPVRIANFTARHSPGYAKRWMQKEVMYQYCLEQNVDAEVALSHMPLGILARVVLLSSAAPENKVAKIIERFNELTPQRIAAKIGWSESDVKETFTTARLLSMCSTQDQDMVLMRIKDTAYKIDTEFSTAAIAKRLGWDLERVERIFTARLIATTVLTRQKPHDVLQRFARHLDTDLSYDEIARRSCLTPYQVSKIFTDMDLREIIRNHADPARKVAQVIANFNAIFSVSKLASALQISQETATSIFSDRTRAYLARRARDQSDNYERPREILRTIRYLGTEHGIRGRIAVKLAVLNSPESAIKNAKLITKEMANKPDDVSDAIWMNVVFYGLSSTHQARLQRLKSLQELFSKPILVDPQEEAWKFDNASEEYSVIPSPAKLDPSPALQALAQKAAVTEDELRQLLLFFANSEACTLEDEEANVLIARVQAVAEES